MADKKNRFQPLTIDGKSLKNPEDFLKNYPAQVIAYHAYIDVLIKRMTPWYNQTQGLKHMKGINLFGMAMGAYLTGDGSAIAFMKTGKSEKDANGTSTERYARWFSQLPMEYYRSPQTGLSAKKKEILISYFETPQQKAESTEIAAVEPISPTTMKNDQTHVERLKSRLDQIDTDRIR